ncbi:MAG TPA: glycogen debranching enzyme N-terminal domain-containing protein, partial [Candidatus Eisenbacteria bacterium]
MPDGLDALVALLDASARTWRLADGRGALARGTASGAATRRGHALLAAPLVGPRAELPAVSLLRFDDRATPADGPAYELTPAFVLASRRDAAPQLAVRAGLLPAVESFREQPWPRWRFRGDGWLIEREYRLIEGHAALLATWRLLEGGPVRLHVAPLLVARSLAGLQSETPEFRGAVSGIPGRVRCLTVEGYAPVTLWHGGAFMPARAWQRGLAYPYDAGGDARDPDAGAATPGEDAFLPGWIQSPLAEPGATLHVVASPEEHLFRALANEQRLGMPPARTLADCLAVLDLAEGDRRETWHRTALDGAAHTAGQAAIAHA